MIWIISGPTAVGKSTFILSPRCAELTGLGPGTPVVWTSKANTLDELTSNDVIFHYNIMRAPELKRLKRERTRSATENSGDGKLRGFKFRFDRFGSWMGVAESSVPKKAIVLVASKETLAQRMTHERPKENPELRGKTRNYSNHKWLGLLESVDLAALYRDWLEELRNASIPYLLVDSTGDTYPIIEDEAALDAIVNGRTTSPTTGAPA